MAKTKKVSLQTYVLPTVKEDYLDICNKRGVSASGEIDAFIKGQIKKHEKEFLND